MEKRTEKLYVQMFSRFFVNSMDGNLSEDNIRSEMLIKLLTYVLCHREKELTVQELVDVLWQDEDSDNPAGALKNLVYRLRTMMKKEWDGVDFILTGRGAYCWNKEVDVIIDAEEFEHLCKSASREELPEQRIRQYLEAMELYKGMFLPKISSEYWVASLSTYYHSMYLTAVKELAGLLEQQHRYTEMGSVCSSALQLESLDEDLYCLLVKALIRQNKLKLAKEQYKKAESILYENLGITPSEELRAVYKELLKQTHDEEMNISAIQDELNDDEAGGAFLCEYGVFKRTYHLEKRRADRLGISVYLALITVVPTLNINKDSQGYLKLVKEGMSDLEEVLLTSLRSGDVISKYSGTQYILLLPTCQYETAQFVMSRIENAFYSKGKKKVKLTFSLGEIEFNYK